MTEYRAALRIAPLTPQLHFNTALIHGQLKSYRAAIRSMTGYLQLAPDAPNARAAKDEIYKWEFLSKEEEEVDARRPLATRSSWPSLWPRPRRPGPFRARRRTKASRRPSYRKPRWSWARSGTT